MKRAILINQATRIVDNWRIDEFVMIIEKI